jgi:hypothetical protein
LRRPYYSLFLITGSIQHTPAAPDLNNTLVIKLSSARHRKRISSRELVVHACNPSYSKAEIRRIAVQSQPGQTVCKTLSQKYPSQKKGMVEWLKV